MFPQASSSGGGFHHGKFPFLHVLHQDLPPFVFEHLAQLWVLTPHSLHPDRSLLCLCLLWHLAVPPAESLFQEPLHFFVMTWMLGISSLA